MSVRKLSTDLKAHFRTCVANGEARPSRSGPEFEKDMLRWRNLLEDIEFWRKADREPQLLRGYSGGFQDRWVWDTLYVFRNCAYGVRGTFTPEEERLLIQDHFDSERRKFERLRHKFELAQHTEPRTERTGIPEEVRVAVWRRDNGRCVRCGSRERLEYDHIIPVSCGGSSTVRNVELLCEKCNCSKGPKIQ